jgi:drug/metabolite transporter (DMT)-like permease
MSFDEKNTWIYAALAVVLPIIYVVFVLRQVPGTPVTEIAYQVPLLVAIGAAIVLAIISSIVIGIFSPKAARTSDPRDKDINRRGEYAGGILLGFGMIVPFALALAEFDQFWIANTMYLVFVLSAITGTAVKLVAYRRGF